MIELPPQVTDTRLDLAVRRAALDAWAARARRPRYQYLTVRVMAPGGEWHTSSPRHPLLAGHLLAAAARPKPTSPRTTLSATDERARQRWQALMTEAVEVFGPAAEQAVRP